jgi:predicted phosphohydrolase
MKAISGARIVKLFVLADLHLDEITDGGFLARLGEAIFRVGQEADVMIVAGDLAEFAVHKWPSALRWLGTHYPSAKTVIITGNHDYYGGNISTLDDQLERICAEAGCNFGQCRRIVLGSTQVLMATLWTDMNLFGANGKEAVADSHLHARQMMPDYADYAITVGNPERRLHPNDTIAVHQKQKAWLLLELSRPWAGKTVVVTHHAPSAAAIGEMTPLSPCFASDLTDEIEKYKPDAWLFGHTHTYAELRMAGGTLLCNVSVGYEDEVRSKDIEELLRRGLIDLDIEPIKGLR